MKLQWKVCEKNKKHRIKPATTIFVNWKMANNRNLREIYDLLDKLSRKFSPDRHKDILKKVTSGISESQHGFVSNVQFDESIILAKIKNHLASKSQVNHATFLTLHEQLTTLTEPKFRSSILTFLLSLSDIETKLPNTLESRDSNGSTFMLPVRTSQASTSASMDQIYRTSTFRVSKSAQKMSKRAKIIAIFMLFLECVNELAKFR